MIRPFGLAAALLLSAAPALAQDAAAPAAPAPAPAPSQAPASPPAQPERAPSAQEAAVMQAATAFGECVSEGVVALAADVAPDAGAATVLGGCAAQKTALEQSVDALIDTLPADRQAAAREHARTQMSEVPADIAAAIRSRPGTPAAAPAQ